MISDSVGEASLTPKKEDANMISDSKGEASLTPKKEDTNMISDSEGEASLTSKKEDDSFDYEPYTFCCSISKVLPEKEVLLKWVFILMNVGVELCQAIFSQEAGEHKIKGNHYKHIAAIFSSACLILSFFEVVYEAKRDRVKWQRKRGCYCFYYPGEYGKIFGRFSLWFGLISATLQLSLNIASLVIKRGVLKFDHLGLLLSVGFLIAALVGDKMAMVATINCNVHGDVEVEGQYREGRMHFQCPRCNGDTPAGSVVEIENHREAVAEPWQESPERWPKLRQRRQLGRDPAAHQSGSGDFDSSSPELGGEEGSEEPARTLQRPRLVWTPQLHKRFVDAVAHLGIKNAVPRTIMQLMSVDGLTRKNVASHLHKYRLYLKRMQGLSNGGAGPGGGVATVGGDREI